MYQGLGTNVQSAQAIMNQIAEIMGSQPNFHVVDGRYLRELPWEKTTHALVMGGGVCSQWEEELQQEAMIKIHEFVNQGGRFLGICAGGYFGAVRSFFILDETRVLIKERSLKFFSGVAAGPFCLDGSYLSPESALAVKIDLFGQERMQQGFCYYQGGPFFDIEESTDSEKIIASYAEPFKKAAVLSCSVGLGKAVLCGLHPEFVWEKQIDGYPVSTFANVNTIAELLRTQESFRKELWNEMIEHLFFKT